MRTVRTTTATGPADDREPAAMAHEYWEQTRARRDVLARQAALVALADRLPDAKRYARDMLAAETVMDEIAQQRRQEPFRKKSSQ
ncbi:hypothetical protein AAGW05_06155 [Arthrobacter sp. LAPM80]|uniref:hypothetical protein n=1 Tax=Arthrobacter sp. LAPM80 TaxID=3141788 RepID=UPI00398B58DA